MHCLYIEVQYDQENYFQIVVGIVFCGQIIAILSWRKYLQTLALKVCIVITSKVCKDFRRLWR